MVSRTQSFDDRLESVIREHLERYAGKYDEAKDKGNKDLLEYELSNRNRAIDRDLLVAYLSLKAARTNNAIQKWVVGLAAVTVAVALLQVAVVLLTR